MAVSLTEKLAIAGAFLALVALAVGTENDPGVVARQAEIAGTVPGHGQPAGRALVTTDNPSTSTAWFTPSGPPEPANLVAEAPAEPLPAGFGATPPAELQK